MLKIDVLKRFAKPKALKPSTAKIKGVYDKCGRLKKRVLKRFAIFSG